MEDQKIDMNALISECEFQKLTDDMLEVKRKKDEMDLHKILLPESDFVKKEYKVTKNVDRVDFELYEKSERRAGRAAALISTVFVLLYLAFMIVFPQITGILIEDGWLFMVPLIMITIKHRLGPDAVGFKKTAYIMSGVFAGLGVLLMLFAYEETGPGDTACVIAYIVLGIPALIVPAVSISRKRILHRIERTVKSRKMIADAEKADRLEADRLRAEDKQKYNDYLKVREAQLADEDEINRQWSFYKEFYDKWCSWADLARINCKEMLDEYCGNIDKIIRAIYSCSFLDCYDELKKPADHMEAQYIIIRNENERIVYKRIADLRNKWE